MTNEGRARTIKSRIVPVVSQVFTIIIAFLVGALVLLATGHSPVSAYGAVLMGAFGDLYGIGQTLTQAASLQCIQARRLKSHLIVPLWGTSLNSILSQVFGERSGGFS